MIFTGKCYDNKVISLKDIFTYVIEMTCCDDYLRLRTQRSKDTIDDSNLDSDCKFVSKGPYETDEINTESNTTIDPEHDSHWNTCIDDLTDMGNDDSLTCNNFGYYHHIARPSRLTWQSSQ